VHVVLREIAQHDLFGATIEIRLVGAHMPARMRWCPDLSIEILRYSRAMVVVVSRPIGGFYERLGTGIRSRSLATTTSPSNTSAASAANRDASG
jgi:hypothetical protein